MISFLVLIPSSVKHWKERKLGVIGSFSLTENPEFVFLAKSLELCLPKLRKAVKRLSEGRGAENNQKMSFFISSLIYSWKWFVFQLLIHFEMTTIIKMMEVSFCGTKKLEILLKLLL